VKLLSGAVCDKLAPDFFMKFRESGMLDGIKRGAKHVTLRLLAGVAYSLPSHSEPAIPHSFEHYLRELRHEIWHKYETTKAGISAIVVPLIKNTELPFSDYHAEAIAAVLKERAGEDQYVNLHDVGWTLEILHKNEQGLDVGEPALALIRESLRGNLEYKLPHETGLPETVMFSPQYCTIHYGRKRQGHDMKYGAEYFARDMLVEKHGEANTPAQAVALANAVLGLLEAYHQDFGTTSVHHLAVKAVEMFAKVAEGQYGYSQRDHWDSPVAAEVRDALRPVLSAACERLNMLCNFGTGFVYGNAELEPEARTRQGLWYGVPHRAVVAPAP
jgi:hypothetical protein